MLATAASHSLAASGLNQASGRRIITVAISTTTTTATTAATTATAATAVAATVAAAITTTISITLSAPNATTVVQRARI